ncbi:MAG: acyl-CoA carboxylase subunit epsilon [Nocardioides sp.]|uniref:acyl-CoA carboxylase subunit epsilon n=1 Tax=Nocardioides sp. TaxID=35761 RepID=UPI003F025E07
MSGEQTTEATQVPAQPVLRVVNPDATPEEIAALVAVFSALGGGAPAPARPRPEWNAPHRQVRRTLPHGLGGWRSSALPR